MLCSFTPSCYAIMNHIIQPTPSHISHRIASHRMCGQIATYLLISHTSAMTLTIGGLFKDVLLVIFSVVFFGSPLTLLQVKRSAALRLDYIHITVLNC